MVCFGSCHLRGRKAMLRKVGSVHQTKQTSIKNPKQENKKTKKLRDKSLQVNYDVKLVLLTSSTRSQRQDFLGPLAH